MKNKLGGVGNRISPKVKFEAHLEDTPLKGNQQNFDKVSHVASTHSQNLKSHLWGRKTKQGILRSQFENDFRQGCVLFMHATSAFKYMQPVW